MKRSGKFYRKNEVEVMKDLGLRPTKNSGSGWVEKEDGQSEDIICQLKSTDAQSIKLNKKDIDTLNYNAAVSHKVPLFVIQFLQSNETYLVIKPEDLEEVYLSLVDKTPKNDKKSFKIDLVDYEDTSTKPSKTIKSSSDAREQYHKEKEKKFRKEKSAK